MNQGNNRPIDNSGDIKIHGETHSAVQSSLMDTIKNNGNKGAIKASVYEKDDSIVITLEINGYNIIGKEINIRIVAPSSLNCTYMKSVHEDNTKCDCDSNIEKVISNLDTQQKEDHLKYPKTLNNNTTITRKNIFEKYKNRSLNNTNANTPKEKTFIHRKGGIDIYGGGKKIEKTETIAITGDKYWYEDEWYHIYDNKNWYLNETSSCRRVSQHLKEKFIQTMTNANESILDRMWMNLPIFLEHPNKREMDLMYGKRDINEIKREHLAELQFFRGAWGKSFRTLMGVNRNEKAMSEEEINRLFPSENIDNDKMPLLNDTTNTEQKLITVGEVQNVIRALPNGKACGLSGGHYEVFKNIASLKKGLKSITRTCNYILKYPNKVHPQIYTSRCIGISKKDGGTRPLCVQESITKILHKVIARKLENVIKDGLVETQKCLSIQEGQIEAWSRVLDSYNSDDDRSFIVVFDFTNAFGTVSRKQIIKRLREKGIPQVYINYINVMLERQQIVYKGENNDLKWKRILRGVPQGEPLSMALFAMGIDSMLDKFNERDYITVTAYADDVVFVVKGEDKLDATITEFEKEAMKRGLKINMKKTSVGYSEIQEQTRALLEARGIKVKNINEDVIEYVGLPITLNTALREQFVEQKTRTFIDDTKILWRKSIPLQMKYHLQEICINSQLTYLYRAVQIEAGGRWMKTAQQELDEIWEKNFDIVPRCWRRVPISMYGMGLFNIKDRRELSRQTYLLKKQGKEADEREVMKERFYIEKINKWINRHKGLQIVKPPFYACTILATPPTEHKLKLDDLAFRLMLAGRYCSRRMDIAFGMCPHHNKQWSLQHMLGCTASVAQIVRAQHDQIVQHICTILMRNHAVTRVKRERKSVEQEERFRAGQKNKRADIVYTKDGAEHSIDVSVTTAWSVNKNSNPILNALKRKKREYSWEKNVHIVLLDTNGGITDEAWSFLSGIGATIHDLRIIQMIIHRATARRYQVITMENKNREYNEERQEHFSEKLNEPEIRCLEC